MYKTLSARSPTPPAHPSFFASRYSGSLYKLESTCLRITANPRLMSWPVTVTNYLVHVRILSNIINRTLLIGACYRPCAVVQRKNYLLPSINARSVKKQQTICFEVRRNYFFPCTSIGTAHSRVHFELVNNSMLHL